MGECRIYIGDRWIHMGGRLIQIGNAYEFDAHIAGKWRHMGRQIDTYGRQMHTIRRNI